LWQVRCLFYFTTLVVTKEGLTVYDYVKTAAKKTPGLKTLAEQLGERFKAIKAKSAKAISNS
jgi:hypothetical protein